MAPSWPAVPLKDISNPLLAQPTPVSTGDGFHQDGNDQSISAELQSVSSEADDAPLLRSASASGKYPNMVPSVVAQRHRRRVPSRLELSILSGPELSFWARWEGSVRRKCDPSPTRRDCLRCSPASRLQLGCAAVLGVQAAPQAAAAWHRFAAAEAGRP